MEAIVRIPRRLGRLPLPVLLGLAVALAVLGGLSAAHYRTTPTAIPFPVPVYQIEATSGSCTGSIANLGIGYVGTLEAPMPVDVNCDLLPDVFVAVNLVDLEGPLNDPLATDSTSYQDFLADRVGRTIAPNIEINRYPLNALSSILGRPSPPVRLNVKLTLKDLQLQEPDTIVRFGYDTGQGGSIPGNFKAVVRGLEDFFNPLEAVVDTKGDLQGGDTVPTYYEGPLTLIGGLSKSDGSFNAKLDIAYKPFPDVVAVGYSSDDDGNHIDYAHGVGEQILRGYGTVLPDGTFEHYEPGVLPEVDMSTKLDVVDHGDTLALTAALDRLPRSVGLDFNTPASGSRMDYAASSDGRLPDARVALRSVSSGELTRAEARIEEIPPQLHAQWSLQNDDAISALFTTSDPDAPDFDLDALGAGPGIGAIEVLYSNIDTPTAFTPFVPTEQQFLNLQTVGGQQLVTGRVEKIRGLKFTTRSDGFDIASRVGDGALPLQANVDVDGLPDTGDLIKATATVSPLPSSIDVNLFNGTKGDLADPFRVVYTSSDGVDVDAHAELREAASAGAACGEPGTTCADVGLRHLPAALTVSMGENGIEGAGATTDVNIDMTPRPGAPKPDVTLDAIMGKLDSVDDPAAVAEAGPVVLEAHGVLRGIPDTVRLHMVEGADETLERLDVATCALDASEACPNGTDPIESLEVQVRNFRDAERADALVPYPSSVAPQFATLTARGIDDPDKDADPTVRFEAAARVRDITEVRYANVNGLFGVRSAVGDQSDLEVLLDVKDVIFDGNDPAAGPVDLTGRALISPLPSKIDVCLREAGFPLSLTGPGSFTDRCEGTDPFLDGSVATTPLTFSYLANTVFDVDATVDLTEHGLLDDVSDDHTIHGVVAVDKVPKDLTAHIQSPPEREEGAPPATEPERLRVRTIAPGATDTNVDLTFEDRFGGATCADPQPAGDITCATATITQLPVYASVLADSGPGEDTHAKVFACDLAVTASTATCRPGTTGLIKELTTRLRMVTGDPVEEGDLVPFVYDEHPFRKTTAAADAYTLALRLDQDDDDNKELRAEGRLAEFRSLSFDRTAEGFDIHTDLGDGTAPLLGSIGIDTRVPADAPPPPEGEEAPTGKLVLADTRIDPLPAQITISQHGPGVDQKANPLEFTYDSSSPVTVDARAQIFDQVAGPLCGDHGTVCASLHLDRLPTHISTTVGTFDESRPDTPEPADVRRRMFIDLDAIPFGSVAAPDLTFDALLGATPEGEPPYDDTPTVAHGELRGFSEKARIRLSQTGVLQADDSLKDGKFEEVLFVTCELVEGSNPPSCGSNPEFPIQEIGVSARNFHQRPTDFPVPRRTDVPDRNLATPALSDPMYAEAVARGDDFEAHAGFTSVREFRMRNVDDVLGVKIRGGDGQAFTAHGDLAGIDLPEKDLTEDGDLFESVERSTLAVDAEVGLSNVPTEFAFCMRQKGAPIKPLSGDFTEPCENQNPFADDGEPFFEAEPPEKAPMSIAYRANAPITQITTKANAQILRTLVIKAFNSEFPSALPTLNLFGDVTIDNLPEWLTAHIETPQDADGSEPDPGGKGGPIRALFYYDDAPSIEAGGPPVDITFAARYTENDAVCRDLRPGQVAYCLSGKLENLPERVKAYIDPEAELLVPGEEGEPASLVKNLRIFADNPPGEKLNLRNLDISAVKDDDPTQAPLILVAEGSILGLPERIDGTIHMPISQEEQDALPEDDPLKYDKPAFDIVASPPLDTVDLQVRNFVAPDPLPPVAAARNGVVPDQTITFLQRGDDFKADVLIHDVAGGGFRTGRNVLGQATETQLIRADFGIPGPGEPKPTIRAYVDLLTNDTGGNPTHVFGDILLDDLPHGIDVCFRGELPRITPDGEDPEPGDRDHDLAAAPGTETFCDGVADNLGAFRFQGRVSGDPEPELDVDAFFRMTKGSDTNVLKAAAKVTNIPNVVQGTFGDGAVAVEMFKADGVTPTGIDDVQLEMADFDFVPDGYGIFAPWGGRVPGTANLPDPQPGPAHEYARVAANDDDFHVKAHLGTAFDGSPGARFTKFIMDPNPCPQPSGSDAWFPHYPANDDDPATIDNDYTCVRGELEQQSTHPLLLDADLVLDGTPLSVHDGGLSQVPKWFQVTITKTATTEAKDVNGTAVPDAARRRCGPEATEPDDARDCMPPLLHFESAANAQLFGTLLMGAQADRDLLRGTSPKRTMVDLNEHPVPDSVRPGQDQWANEFPVAGGQGVRAKIGTNLPGDAKVIQASFRLPVPRALTVDQIQDWSFKDDVTLREASDLRFHFVMRDTNGVALGNIGDLALMLHNFKDQGQTLVGHVSNDQRGIPIPGEFGIDYYGRKNDVAGRELIQADLRTSTDLDARVRLIAGSGASLGDADFKLTGLKGATADMAADEPSFRLRAELKNPPVDPNAPPPEPDEDDWKDDLLCLVWCIGTDIGHPEITAKLDLAPTSTPVRLVEAVVNTAGDTKLGAEIRTFADIEGTTTAKFASENGELGINPFATGGIHIDIDPFNMFVHAGVPILAGFDLLLLSEANVDLEIAPTNRFLLKMDTTKLTTASEGASFDVGDAGSDTWLQVSLDPALLAGYFSLFWPFPPVYLWYAIEASPVLPFYFYQCPTPVWAGPVPYTLPIADFERDVTAFLPFAGPFPVPPLFTFGTPIVKEVLDAVFGLAGPPILCAIFDTGDLPLHSGEPPSTTGDRSPGDSVVLAGHPVAGLGISAAPVTTPPDPPDPPESQDLVVNSGQTLTLCGTHVFEDITIASGGTLNVGTSASNPGDPEFVECPDNYPDDPSTVDDPDEPGIQNNEFVQNVGRLNLVGENVTIDGTVNGPGETGTMTITGGELTLNGTVNVNDGHVELQASGDLTITSSGNVADVNGYGNVTSQSPPLRSDNGAAWAAASTNNAGASHHGAGGAGTGPGGSTAGPAYGSGTTANTDIDPGTERGYAGKPASTSGGGGGGSVAIRGNHVEIAGDVDMGATGATSNNSGACFVLDTDPDTAGNQSSPNTGVRAGAGGSGGGIAVHGVDISVTGHLWVDGGAGGSARGGAGGGGGGGLIRLNAGDVDYVEGNIHLNGGPGGTSGCPADFGNGGAGGDGALEVTETPQSLVTSTGQFWYQEDNVEVPYRASAAEIDGFLGFDNDDFDVYLCGIHRGPEALEEGGDYGLVMPTGAPDPFHPCGTAANGDELSPTMLRKVSHTNTELAEGTLTPSGDLSAGVWGLWTVAAKPDTSLFGGGCWPFWPDFDVCTLELNPTTAEMTIAVDDVDPSIAVAPDGTTTGTDGSAVTRSADISISLTQVLDTLPKTDTGSVNASGVSRWFCYVDDGGGIVGVPCQANSDSIGLTLPGGEGRYDVYVVAEDNAFNLSAPFSGDVPDAARFDDDTADPFDDDRITFVLDTTPPAPGSAAVTAPGGGPNGDNGWYTTIPTEYTINGYDDGAVGSGEPTAGGFQYRFDGADWATCLDPCVISAPTPLPQAGNHTLTWKAVDAAGLESAEQSLAVLIDTVAPKSVITAIPVPVPGEWITAAHPLVVVRGADEFDGSGVATTYISKTGTAGPWLPYTGPVELSSGEDQVICTYSTDGAGNTEIPLAGTASCTVPLDIDNQLPTGNITVAPAAPTGNPPWYDGDAPVPTVTLSGYDGTGSPAPVGGGFRYRVDNSAELSCGDPCVVSPALLGAGSNVLHWTVVDSAGNRAPEREVALHIDIDDPRSHILVEAPKPDGANGWHLSKPSVTLAGFDEPKGTTSLRPLGSGIRYLRYTLDGGPAQTYTAPFFISKGDHTLCVVASDVAGNDEAGRDPNCKRIAFDPDDPTTSILENGLVTPAPNGDGGWYKLADPPTPVNVTHTSADTTPGSGLAGPTVVATCDHDPETSAGTAGVCISVDGRAPGAAIDGPEFGPYTGAVRLGEGDHVIRAFSVDKAGRRSAMDRNVVHIDRSDPVTKARLRAPQESRVGLLRPWWRHQPTLVLRALDGDQNAGIRRIEYRIDGGAVQTYGQPVTMPVGIHYVEHRAVDEAGRVGPWVRKDVAVDVTPPVVKATTANPSPLWLNVNLLGIIKIGPDKTKLQWEITDELSGRVQVKLIVYNVAGLAVRHLDGGVQTVTPGVKKSGYTLWDGSDDSIIGFLPAGVYYYRAIAIDDAGNVAMSGESSSLQIKLKLVL
jgi:hypothetical protein